MAKLSDKEKLRKKKWFPVLAPALFKEQVIGEIYLYDAKDMLNRKITANMMTLTNNPRNQHINIHFRINEVKDNKGLTEMLGWTMMPTSVKRLVRRGKTKIDDSIVVLTADKKKVRIKPLIITNSLIKKPVATLIRNMTRNELFRLVGKLTYSKLIEEITSFKLQKHLGDRAAQITPIRESEIRAFELVEREGVKVFTPSKQKQLAKEESEEFEEEVDEEVGEKEEQKGDSKDKSTKESSDEPVEETEVVLDEVDEVEQEQEVEDEDLKEETH